MAAPLHRILAGEDGPGRRALPLGELLHPAPLAALALLAANDHLLKGSDLVPAAVTGKLSDFAGLLFFPLLATAALDLLLLALGRAGVPVDFSLRRWKLALACGGTAALFVAIKSSAGAAEAVARLLGGIGFPSTITVDRTDLVALPMIALAWWLGRREIARVPLGRIEVLERARARGRGDTAGGLADVTACGADGARVDALARALDAYFTAPDDAGRAARASAALRSIRAPTAAPDDRP